jgi:hypothetical protein
MTTTPFLALAFAAGATLHDVEEGLFLADWEARHLKLWFQPDRRAFWIGIMLVSAWAWIAVLWPIDTMLPGIALAMAANALFQHLPLSPLERWPGNLAYAIGFGVLSFAGLAAAHLIVAPASRASPATVRPRR